MGTVRTPWYGLFCQNKLQWAKSRGEILRFWGLDRAREAWLEWQTAQAHLGAAWTIKRLE
jgi:hypothetical protein